MKSVGLVSLTVALCYEAANAQAFVPSIEDPGQAAVLSRDKFKQYAAAFLGMNDSSASSMVADFFDSDDSDDAPPKKKANASVAKTPVQHGGTTATSSSSSSTESEVWDTASRKADAEVKANAHGTRKLVAHGATSAALLDTSIKANVHAAKKSGRDVTASAALLHKTDRSTVHAAHTTVAAAVKATVAARAGAESLRLKADEAATSAQLKAQLAQAVQVESNLRTRLKALGTEARSTLKKLFQQLQVAKAGAQRSESQLKKQVLAAEDSAASARRDAAAATARAAAKEQADRKAVNKLRDEFFKEVANLKHQEAEVAKGKNKLKNLMAAAKSFAPSSAKSVAKDEAEHEKSRDVEVKKLREEFKAAQMQSKQDIASVKREAEASKSDLEKQLAAAKASALSAHKADQASESVLEKEIAAAKASALSTRKSDLEKAKASSLKGEAEHEEVRKLREELKATQMQAKKENGALRDQLKQLQQAGAKTNLTGWLQSQLTDQQVKQADAAARAEATNTKAGAPKQNTLQMMAQFLAKPLPR